MPSHACLLRFGPLPRNGSAGPSLFGFVHEGSRGDLASQLRVQQTHIIRPWCAWRPASEGPRTPAESATKARTRRIVLITKRNLGGPCVPVPRFQFGTRTGCCAHGKSSPTKADLERKMMSLLSIWFSREGQPRAGGCGPDSESTLISRVGRRLSGNET